MTNTLNFTCDAYETISDLIRGISFTQWDTIALYDNSGVTISATGISSPSRTGAVLTFTGILSHPGGGEKSIAEIRIGPTNIRFSMEVTTYLDPEDSWSSGDRTATFVIEVV